MSAKKEPTARIPVTGTYTDCPRWDSKDDSVLRKNLPPRNPYSGLASLLIKIENVRMPPSVSRRPRMRSRLRIGCRATYRLRSPSSRRVHAGDLRRGKRRHLRQTRGRCRPFSSPRIVRSHEKVAVCQNLGLDMSETPGVARNPTTSAGSHDFAADCHCAFLRQSRV